MHDFITVSSTSLSQLFHINMPLWCGFVGRDRYCLSTLALLLQWMTQYACHRYSLVNPFESGTLYVRRA